MKRDWATALRPQRLPFRRYLTRASVALIYREAVGGERELLFIQRAHRPGDPWSGDMAFPGGRMQPEDTTPMLAAQRETLEETGLDLVAHGHFRGRLSDLVTRHHSRWRPMVVTPYVFEWRGPDRVALNHEVFRSVWINLEELTSDRTQSVRLWRTPVGNLRLPCCQCGPYCIWGLSYSMLQEYLRWSGQPVAKRTK